jgi:8-oxo-dGTP diphosphatase
MRQATLVFLLREDEILLAMKKRGFGLGRWNGVGGKRQEGEMIEETAKRETLEEIGVEVEQLEHRGTLDFHFPHNPDWGQTVFVYLVTSWKHEPAESEEMLPKWFKRNEIPFESMWPSDIFWLPKVIGGKKIKGEFTFKEGDQIERMIVEEL